MKIILLLLLFLQFHFWISRVVLLGCYLLVGTYFIKVMSDGHKIICLGLAYLTVDGSHE